VLWNEIRANPEEHFLVVTEPSLASSYQREKHLELFFDKYEVPMFYMNVAPLFPLCGLGRRTGCIVDVGDGVTQVLPIYASHWATQVFESF